MLKAYILPIIFFSFFSFAFLNCKTSSPSPNEILSATKEKLKNSSTVHYTLTGSFDNRSDDPNPSISAEIFHSKIEDSYHGFGFYASTKESEVVYDGFDMYEIMHPQKTVARVDPEEIKKEGYFDNNIIVTESPFNILEKEKFDFHFDTIINKKEYLVFQEEESPFATSKNPRNKIIKRFFIEKDAKIITLSQLIFLNGKDTTRIINNTFTDFRFEDKPYDFSQIDPRNVSNIDNATHARYQEMSQKDFRKQRQMEHIKEGTQLTEKGSKNIKGENVFLGGKSDKKTMIMFSFIGCGPCEYALEVMRKKDYSFNKEIEFYYSSPYNNRKALKKYLKKKEFPFGAFSKESHLGDDFSIFSYPTFVLIDKDGKVEKVMRSFSKEVEEIIFNNVE